MQHLSSVVPEALITCCSCRVAYHFFIIGQKTFMQCYTVALQKRLESAPVHAGRGRAKWYKIIRKISGGSKTQIYPV